MLALLTRMDFLEMSISALLTIRSWLLPGEEFVALHGLLI